MVLMLLMVSFPEPSRLSLLLNLPSAPGNVLLLFTPWISAMRLFSSSYHHCILSSLCISVRPVGRVTDSPSFADLSSPVTAAHSGYFGLACSQKLQIADIDLHMNCTKNVGGFVVHIYRFTENQNGSIKFISVKICVQMFSRSILDSPVSTQTPPINSKR